MDKDRSKNESVLAFTSNIEKFLLRNVQTNNLKIDELVLEEGKIYAIGGPSGAGKSSLLFDTIHVLAYEELSSGQSARLKQYSKVKGQALVGEYSGLMPVIALDKISAPSIRAQPLLRIQEFMICIVCYIVVSQKRMTESSLSTILQLFHLITNRVLACTVRGWVLKLYAMLITLLATQSFHLLVEH